MTKRLSLAEALLKSLTDTLDNQGTEKKEKPVSLVPYRFDNINIPEAPKKLPNMLLPASPLSTDLLLQLSTDTDATENDDVNLLANNDLLKPGFAERIWDNLSQKLPDITQKEREELDQSVRNLLAEQHEAQASENTRLNLSSLWETKLDFAQNKPMQGNNFKLKINSEKSTEPIPQLPDDLSDLYKNLKENWGGRRNERLEKRLQNFLDPKKDEVKVIGLEITKKSFFGR